MRFKKGNKFGRGNPFARKSSEIRAAMYRAASPEVTVEIMEKVVAMSKQGDIAAIKEYFSRLLGPSVAVDIIERIEKLESRAGIKNSNGKEKNAGD